MVPAAIVVQRQMPSSGVRGLVVPAAIVQAKANVPRGPTVPAAIVQAKANVPRGPVVPAAIVQAKASAPRGPAVPAAIVQRKVDPGAPGARTGESVVQRFWLVDSSPKGYGWIEDNLWDEKKYVKNESQTGFFIRSLYKRAPTPKTTTQPIKPKSSSGVAKQVTKPKSTSSQSVSHTPAIVPPRTYAGGDLIDIDEVDDASAWIKIENKKRKSSYEKARLALAQFEAEAGAYMFDRQKSVLPMDVNHGIAISDGARTQVYRNNNRLFPNSGGLTYREIDLNSGFMAAGNLRRILPSNPVGNYEFWAGSNITHGGTKWIRAWNSALRYWQEWVPTGFPSWGGTANDLPGHTNLAPAGISAATRSLATSGTALMEIKVQGFQCKIIETKHGG